MIDDKHITIVMQSISTHFDPLDRSNGNGSGNWSDGTIDEQSIYDNPWGSNATTTFNPSGEDAYGDPIPKEKQQKLERLYEWHHGKGESGARITTSHMENDAEMFMSALEMPEVQRERVRNILDHLDTSSNNFGSRKYEKIILALCTLISDEFLTERPNPSIDDRLFLTDQFREFMDCTSMSSSELRKIRKAIREKSDYFDQSP